MGRRVRAPPKGEPFAMTTALAAVTFVAGSACSLAAAWVLVSRIERTGNRLGFTEAMLGLVAAVAADAPEITSAVSALLGHQPEIGSGVVVGSNVFNLAALVGLGAVVAGSVVLHRRAVVLTGAISLWIAAVCVATVCGVLPVGVAVALVFAVLVPYAALAASRRTHAGGGRVRCWLRSAMTDEELELKVAHAPGAHRGDLAVGLGALVVVVVASVAMERAASTLGTRLDVPAIVTGAVVLAAVTSLPNAVAAVYLARRGRGAAMLSTALNSNALNVAFGLLLPAAFVGLGPVTGQQVMISVWYAGLTAVVLVCAYRFEGLRRGIGILILLAYAVFAVTLIVIATEHRIDLYLVLGTAVLTAAMAAIALGRPRGDGPVRRPAPSAGRTTADAGPSARPPG
jgi:cation:H+ antiporter